MLRRKVHTPEAVRATAALADHQAAVEREAATVQALAQEPAELAPEQASLAARALVGEQERAAQARDTGRAQVQVPALEEEPARAPERDRRVQSEMATRAVRLAEPRAALPAAAQAPNSSAWVVRVQEAVPEVTTAAARELAFCSAMKAAMAADADQAPEAEQAAAVVGKRATVAEEQVLELASREKRESIAFSGP